MNHLDTPARLASALLPRVWSRLPVGDRRVFLTFDDGPSEATWGVLDRLENVGAEASFFVLGEQVAAFPEQFDALRARGHTVGSHGRRHTDPWRVADPGRWAGGDARWLRPPFGHVTPGLIRHAVRHRRHVALWDVMPADFDRRLLPEQVAARVLRGIRPGSIIVLHDGPQMTGRIESILDRLLPRLQHDGWQTAALPDQPGADT